MPGFVRLEQWSDRQLVEEFMQLHCHRTMSEDIYQRELKIFMIKKFVNLKFEEREKSDTRFEETRYQPPKNIGKVNPANARIRAEGRLKHIPVHQHRTASVKTEVPQEITTPSDQGGVIDWIGILVDEEVDECV
jgi:hypothetical protein